MFRSLRLEKPEWNVCVGILLSGSDADGLLGMNFLQQFASLIDQQEGVLRLGEKS